MLKHYETILKISALFFFLGPFCPLTVQCWQNDKNRVNNEVLPRRDEAIWIQSLQRTIISSLILQWRLRTAVFFFFFFALRISAILKYFNVEIYGPIWYEKCFTGGKSKLLLPFGPQIARIMQYPVPKTSSVRSTKYRNGQRPNALGRRALYTIYLWAICAELWSLPSLTICE